MNTQTRIIIIFGVVLLVVGGIWWYTQSSQRAGVQTEQEVISEDVSEVVLEETDEVSNIEKEVIEKTEPILQKPKEVSEEFNRFGLSTNTAQKSIDLSLVLSGGPGKDGIPAINSPKFVSQNNVEFGDDALGIFLDMEGVKRFYPYAILVWHEIVNDKLGDRDVAVTFCPLCASAIVFDRRVGNDVLTFGVSGLLYESNLLMYDTKTESLWSQAKNEAVVGDFTGTRLTVLPLQLLTIGELKEKYPQAKILSTDTGHSRNYGGNPYSGYENNDSLYFPVSVSDNRYPTKEVMFIVPLEDVSVAIPQLKLKDKQAYEFKVNEKDFVITRDGGELEVIFDGKEKAGYYEMWFSWATHHKDDGLVLDPDK
jgi:hypothetical protein